MQQKTESMKIPFCIGQLFLIFIFSFVLFIPRVFSQQSEYRISDDRRYQYLSNRQEAGMVYDESLGSYYKDITLRTFYLETNRKGYIPNYISYETFTKMTLSQQRAVLLQTYRDPRCTADNMSSECLDFTEQEIQIPRSPDAQVVDLSPKCVDLGNSPEGKMSLTTKMLVNPGNASVENIDCGDPVKPSSDPDDPRMKEQQRKNVKMILGKD